jgi:hypothetical protein
MASYLVRSLYTSKLVRLMFDLSRFVIFVYLMCLLLVVDLRL